MAKPMAGDGLGAVDSFKRLGERHGIAAHGDMIAIGVGDEIVACGAAVGLL